MVAGSVHSRSQVFNAKEGTLIDEAISASISNPTRSR